MVTRFNRRQTTDFGCFSDPVMSAIHQLQQEAELMLSVVVQYVCKVIYSQPLPSVIHIMGYILTPTGHVTNYSLHFNPFLQEYWSIGGGNRYHIKSKKRKMELVKNNSWKVDWWKRNNNNISSRFELFWFIFWYFFHVFPNIAKCYREKYWDSK